MNEISKANPKNKFSLAAGRVTRCGDFEPFGQFFKTLGAFSISFINCWAIFGNNSYIVVALRGF